MLPEFTEPLTGTGFKIGNIFLKVKTFQLSPIRVTYNYHHLKAKCLYFDRNELFNNNNYIYDRYSTIHLGDNTCWTALCICSVATLKAYVGKF